MSFDTVVLTIKKGINQMKKIYQIAYLNQNCKQLKVSACVERPTKEEIDARNPDDYRDENINLNDILLSESSYDGKLELGNDWSLFEGTIEEIEESADNLIIGGSWGHKTAYKIIKEVYLAT